MPNGTRTTIPCPSFVTTYNKYMGGVDRNDQLRQHYSVRLKGRKCYKYVWWFMFDVAITNAYIVCKNHTCLSVPTLKNFRIILARELIGTYSSRKRRGRHPERPISQPFSIGHFPQKSDRFSRCHYCLKKKKERHETKWFCNACDLHLYHNGKDDCFLLHHTTH